MTLEASPKPPSVNIRDPEPSESGAVAWQFWMVEVDAVTCSV